MPGGLLSDLRIAIGIRRRGDRVRFVFPGDVAVTPGQSYAIRVSSRVTFGWKYAVGGYERGAATFNGRPLVTGTRTTFLFRTLGSNWTRREAAFIAARARRPRVRRLPGA